MVCAVIRHDACIDEGREVISAYRMNLFRSSARPIRRSRPGEARGGRAALLALRGLWARPCRDRAGRSPCQWPAGGHAPEAVGPADGAKAVAPGHGFLDGACWPTRANRSGSGAWAGGWRTSKRVWLGQSSGVRSKLRRSPAIATCLVFESCSTRRATHSASEPRNHTAGRTTSNRASVHDLSARSPRSTVGEILNEASDEDPGLDSRHAPGSASRAHKAGEGRVGT